LPVPGLRIRIYYLRDFTSPDFAFAYTASRTSGPRTSRPHGLPVPGLRVRIYYLRDFTSPDFAFAFTASGTSGPRTSCPHLLLQGLRVRIYCLRDFRSPDFASAFTASGTSGPRTSRPHLQLQGLRVPGLRVRIYSFRDFGFPDFDSACTALGTSGPRTSCPHGLRVPGLRVRIYYFRDFESPDFVSAYTALGTSGPRTSRPHLLLQGLRVPGLRGLRVPGLRVRIYYFRDFESPDFVSAYTALGTSGPRTSRPHLLLQGLRVPGLRGLRVPGLRVRIYYFRDFESPDFVSAYTALGTSGPRTSRPHLLLQGLRVPGLRGLRVPGLRVRIYYFRDFESPDFVSAYTALGTSGPRTSRPHLLLQGLRVPGLRGLRVPGLRVRIYYFRDFESPDFVSAYTALGTSGPRTSRPHLLLQGLRVPGLRGLRVPGLRVRIYYFRDFESPDFVSAYTALGTSGPRTSRPHLLLQGLRVPGLRGLRVPGLRVRIYYFRDFESPDFVSAYTALGTSGPRTSRPHLLLQGLRVPGLRGLRVPGLRVRIYYFRDFESPDFVSAYTALGTSGPRTSRPHLLLQGLRVPGLRGLRVPGLRVRIYYFRDFESPDFVSAYTALGTSGPRTSRPHLLLEGLHVPGLRVRIYCFRDFESMDFGSPDFASAFTA
ncbi:hypothetical protein CRG98_043136, partial [Punica granatum]